MPRGLNTEFVIGKVDHQVNGANRLSARYIFFDNFITNNVGGGIGSVQRATDFSDRQHSTAVQLISTIRTNVLNELRVQYATRAQSRAPGSQAGTGPAINITNVANFGGPVASLTDAGFGFTQDVSQVNNSLTYLRGDHSFKGGFDIQHVADLAHRARPLSSTRSPTVAAYQAARSGANPFGYNTFQQYFGEPDPGLLVEHLRPVPAGRLARVATRSRCSTACVTTSTTCRRPTPTRRSRPRATSSSTRTTSPRVSAWCGRWAATAARWYAPTPA